MLARFGRWALGNVDALRVQCSGQGAVFGHRVLAVALQTWAECERQAEEQSEVAAKLQEAR